MEGNVRDNIWAWKGISNGKKKVGLIPLANFRVVWKEKNMRAFKGVEANFDRVRDR